MLLFLVFLHNSFYVFFIRGICVHTILQGLGLCCVSNSHSTVDSCKKSSLFMKVESGHLRLRAPFSGWTSIALEPRTSVKINVYILSLLRISKWAELYRSPLQLFPVHSVSTIFLPKAFSNALSIVIICRVSVLYNTQVFEDN